MLSVALVVTISVAVVGLGTSELDPAIAPTRAASLPADPADISRLPVFSPAISQQVIGRVMTLITAMQALLGGVAVVTLLAAASSRSRSGSGSSACSTRWAAPPPSSQVPRRSARAGALGAIGAALGLPLGLGTYLLFKAMAGGGFTGSPPPLPSPSSPWRPSPSPPPPAPAPPCSPNASRPTKPSPPNSLAATGSDRGGRP